MEIERAVHYILDYSSRTINSDYTEAINTIVGELRRLQKEVTMLKEDKIYKGEKEWI